MECDEKGKKCEGCSPHLPTFLGWHPVVVQEEAVVHGILKGEGEGGYDIEDGNSRGVEGGDATQHH